MNKLGSIGSSVIVGRAVGVKVGKGVFVTSGVPVGGVVVGSGVLITNKSGVKVAGKPNGVTVGPGVFTGVGVCRKGIEIGKPEQPERREIITIIIINLLISPLMQEVHGFDKSSNLCVLTSANFSTSPRCYPGSPLSLRGLRAAKEVYGFQCGCQSGSGLSVTCCMPDPSARMINISA